MHFGDVYGLFLKPQVAVSVLIVFGQGSCLQAQPHFWDILALAAVHFIGPLKPEN